MTTGREEPEPSPAQRALAADVDALFGRYESDKARARVEHTRRTGAVPDAEDVATVERQGEP